MYPQRSHILYYWLKETRSARGNTTLESALDLTKKLRWDIQALGTRLSNAASAEEKARKSKTRAKSQHEHELEIRLIVTDIKKLIARIENDIPLINLAITTSGASLSTSLPPTVSPSRLLQASTFLTAGDTQYSMSPGIPVQVGPGFTLSLYMLFAGHSNRIQEDGSNMRETTWKEVIHKARVKLMRVPLEPLPEITQTDSPVLQSIEGFQISGEGKQNEYSYRIEIIEDLDDDRAHSYEEGEAPPGPYGDVLLAGIREFLPIHQISKIFYADTGKILNIGNEGEPHNPVLLLKRDINALAPRKAMQEAEKSNGWDEYEDEEEDATSDDTIEDNEDEGQDDIDEQIRRESSVVLPGSPIPTKEQSTISHNPWSLPPGLDPEWLALEVYTEEEEDSSSEDEQEQDQYTNDDSAYVSHRPSSSGEGLNSTNQNTAQYLSTSFTNLQLNPTSSPPAPQTRYATPNPTPAPYPAIRSSLSLFEMLIRLTALQQFQQTSHLSVPDEFLTFFLEESSTSGAGVAEERKRMRREARMKVGFDPYDESPIKRHGEEYQYGGGGADGQWDAYPPRSRTGTPWGENDARGGFPSSPGFRERERSMTPQRGAGSPQMQQTQWLHQSPSRRNSPLPMPVQTSPISPYRGVRQRKGPVERVQSSNRAAKGKGSPLALGGGEGAVDSDPDSTLGMSPGSPILDGKASTRIR
jgi:hypothetical protein